MMTLWTFHHLRETASTNRDAAHGRPGDVFTADFQTAGRGRLDHAWLSPPGANLMMSVVLDVASLDPERVSTLPLVVGLSVAEGLSRFLPASLAPQIKWPNDVLVGERKISGILCERHGDSVVAGIGVNVAQTAFPPELAAHATSLALLGSSITPATRDAVRDALLAALDANVALWRARGFAALHARLASRDALKGRFLSVRQSDVDREPVTGACGGIAPDGTLLVGSARVYAGEAHVIRRT